LRKSRLMPRANGPSKIIEKINDNAYKLELPPEFGVSPTFNISDLRLYLGEEDEFESKTTPIQEGEDDEDITLSDTHNPRPLVIQGPISRARARQLNQQVSSFLSSSACTYENSMLPNEIIDYIVLRNFGEDHEGLGNQQGQGGRLGGGGVQIKVEAQIISESAISDSRTSVHQIHRPGHKRTPISATHICLER
jgi:hypothetical protein